MVFHAFVLNGLKKVALGLAVSSLGLAFWGEAQASERYPNEREMQQFRLQFPRRIQEVLSGSVSYYLDDNRTPATKQQYQAFVNAWSRVNPAIAPFLGSWVGYEERVTIYPTNTPNKVCIIEGNEEGFTAFTIGRVLSNGDLRTDNRKFIIRSGNYLASAGIYDNQIYTGDLPLHSPRPPFVPSLSTLATLEETPAVENEKRQTLRRFNAEGCKAQFPN
ncbi:MAG: hypothetical protein SAJ11_20315 [Jaaginema sp. PMC 1078.18]|nr:hypothetical protein [Jaaginema sp. PMC 1078.18]